MYPHIGGYDWSCESNRPPILNPFKLPMVQSLSGNLFGIFSSSTTRTIKSQSCNLIGCLFRKFWSNERIQKIIRFESKRTKTNGWFIWRKGNFWLDKNSDELKLRKNSIIGFLIRLKFYFFWSTTFIMDQKRKHKKSMRIWNRLLVKIHPFFFV